MVYSWSMASYDENEFKYVLRLGRFVERGFTHVFLVPTGLLDDHVQRIVDLFGCGAGLICDDLEYRWAFMISEKHWWWYCFFREERDAIEFRLLVDVPNMIYLDLEAQ